MARIVTAIATSRAVGIALLLGWQNGTIPAYYAFTFASGISSSVSMRSHSHKCPNEVAS